VRKLRLTVQYDGTDYAGFQIQPNAATIQGELEQTLADLLGHPVRVQAASRTDAGVHALGQVVAFETDNPIPAENLAKALDDKLPVAISAVAAHEVAGDFDPQRDARRKLYCYQILNRTVSSPFLGRYAWHVSKCLDDGAICEAGSVLLGRHDFAAFCASGSSVRSTVRTIYRLNICREGDMFRIYVEADGFLYKMARIMVGTLVEVGWGRMAPDVVGEILASGDRRQAGPTAPGCGLWLVEVSYD